MRFLLSLFLGGSSVALTLAADAAVPPATRVDGYYAEAEFTTPTLGDDYWANFRKTMEVQCPLAYQRPFVWHGPTTGFGLIKSAYHRAGNVVVSTKRYLVPHRLGGPWEMEAVERVEYLRKEKRADGTDIIESTKEDPTGKTLRHRFQPGPPARLDFIGNDQTPLPTGAQPAATLIEKKSTTYLGYPAVSLVSVAMKWERVQLADDPQVPVDLRNTVMAETRYGANDVVVMATRTLVLKVLTFDASILDAPEDVQELPQRK